MVKNKEDENRFAHLKVNYFSWIKKYSLDVGGDTLFYQLLCQNSLSCETLFLILPFSLFIWLEKTDTRHVGATVEFLSLIILSPIFDQFKSGVFLIIVYLLLLRYTVINKTWQIGIKKNQLCIILRLKHLLYKETSIYL